MAISPLTKTHRQEAGLVERFEPYIAGLEIGNAYTELNDPLQQRKRLESQKQERSLSGEDSAPPVDESFLHALETGLPPTGGAGLGVERLVMLLTDQAHIQDILMFPLSKTERALKEPDTEE